VAVAILLVDDDKVTVGINAAALRGAGYHVSVAYDAMQGFRIAHRDRPALVVLDIMMPAGGGLQVLDRLTQSSHTDRIPVLVVTGSTEPGLEETVRNRGADGFLAKPTTPQVLVAAVTQLLEQSKPESGPDQNRT
jgi:DNA-binding response OmpR family regulator